jgi:pimeloyl-ACP methyl ester carboxylesterase
MARVLLVLFVPIFAVIAFAPLLLIDPRPLPPERRGTSPGHEGRNAVTLASPAGKPGLELHVRDSGAEESPRRSFVLLHGFTFNLYTWDRIYDALMKHGRVIAYDQIPYGFSDKPVPGDRHEGHPYTRKAALDRLFSLLDHYDIDRVILIGNSSGAALALEAARAQPKRIEGLVLLAPWVFSHRPSLPDWFTTTPQVRRLLLWLARELGTGMPLLDRSYHRPDRIDDQRRRLAGVHRQIEGWDMAWAALLTRSLSEPMKIGTHLEEIRIPVMVIAGQADRIVPAADSLAASRRLPMATFLGIENCGHVPQEECPHAVTLAIDRWLRTLP